MSNYNEIKQKLIDLEKQMRLESKRKCCKECDYILICAGECEKTRQMG